MTKCLKGAGVDGRREVSAHAPGTPTTTEAAAHWHLLQREGALSPADQQRFMDWLVASPLHLREYLAMARVAAELGDAVRAMPTDAEVEAFITGHRRDDNVVALGRARIAAATSSGRSRINRLVPVIQCEVDRKVPLNTAEAVCSG